MAASRSNSDLPVSMAQQLGPKVALAALLLGPALARAGGGVISAVNYREIAGGPGAIAWLDTGIDPRPPDLGNFDGWGFSALYDARSLLGIGLDNDRLIELGSEPTSGNGQALTFVGRELFLVNGGTNTLAHFQCSVSTDLPEVEQLLLECGLIDEVPSGGLNPTSLVEVPIFVTVPNGGLIIVSGTTGSQLVVANRDSNALSIYEELSDVIDGTFSFSLVDVVLLPESSTPTGVYWGRVNRSRLFRSRRLPAALRDGSAPHEGRGGPPGSATSLNSGATGLGLPLAGADLGGIAAEGAVSGQGEAQSIVGVTFDGTNAVGLFIPNEHGSLTPLQPSIPLGVRPRRVRFSSEGDMLYVAAAIRTSQQPNLQDEIRAYRIGPAGELTLESTTLAGRFLTDMQVIPGGLVAATVSNNNRNEIRAYRREGATLTLDAAIETSPPGQIPSFQQLAVSRRCGPVESTRILVTEYQASRLGSMIYTPDGAAPTPCVELTEERFRVRVDWRVPDENRSGVATATGITPDTGHFWFFDPANVELVVKVLDARVINGHFWVFYGALTDVEYTITVTDTQTGATRSYFSPAGTQASGADTSAFADAGAGSAVVTDADARAVTESLHAEIARLAHGTDGERAARATASSGAQRRSAAAADCTTNNDALCLAGSRFEVRVDWSAPGGDSGTGNAVPLSTDTGYFWFFDDANVELIVKVLDARVINGKFWVFYGALSDVEYTITVTDTETGAQKTYSNPAGTLGSGSDTSAF